MKCLLDSNVVLWMLTDRSRLTPRVLGLLEDDANNLYVSLGSIWELSIKIAKGKLVIPGGSASSLVRELRRVGVTFLAVDEQSILRTETLAHIHNDPFDRLLIAQALELDFTILTADRTIPLYGVRVIWA